MTDTNYTIPKKVFIFENDVTDGFIVLEIFPYDIIVRSQTNDPAEAKLRLAHFLRDEVGANAALEMHFDENLFGGSYVAKIALMLKIFFFIFILFWSNDIVFFNYVSFHLER